jgi:hypothetical protein
MIRIEDQAPKSLGLGGQSAASRSTCRKKTRSGNEKEISALGPMWDFKKYFCQKIQQKIDPNIGF